MNRQCDAEMIHDVLDRDGAQLDMTLPDRLNKLLRVSFVCQCGAKSNKVFEQIRYHSGAYCWSCSMKNRGRKAKATKAARIAAGVVEADTAVPPDAVPEVDISENEEVIDITPPSSPQLTDTIPIEHNVPLASNLVAEHGGQIIAEMRDIDGYVNATKMCKSGGKEWKQYMRNATTTNFLVALESKVHIPILDLVQSRPGGDHSGTWVHHQVAIHLAMWISPVFAVAVTDLVTRFLGGKTAVVDGVATTDVVALHAINYRPIIKSIAFSDNLLAPIPPDVPGLYFALLKEVRNDKFIICEEVPEGKSVVGFGYSESSIRDRIDAQNIETGGCYQMLDYHEDPYPRLLEKELKQCLKYQLNILQLSGKCVGKPGRKKEFFAANQGEYATLVEHMINVARHYMEEKRKTERMMSNDLESRKLDLEFQKVELRKVEIEHESAARIAEAQSETAKRNAEARIAEAQTAATTAEVRKLELQLEIMKFKAQQLSIT